MVAISLAIDRAGAIVAGPEIASRGFVYVKEHEPLLEELKKAVLAALAEPAAPSERERIGATDPAQAGPGTIRKLFAESKGRNSVHASDSPASADREVKLFFGVAALSR